MANYDPFDPVAMSFTKQRRPLQCDNSGDPWLTRAEGGTLIVNETLLRARRETLDSCRYERVVRVSDRHISYSEPKVFRRRIDVEPDTDHVRVTCNVMTSSSQVSHVP